MYNILIGIAVFIVGIPFCFYFLDKRLKTSNLVKTNKLQLVSLSKTSFMFLYYDRRKKIITKFVLVATLVFYLMNFTALIFLIIHLFTDFDPSFITGIVWLLSNIIFILGVEFKFAQQRANKDRPNRDGENLLKLIDMNKEQTGTTKTDKE